MKENTCNYSDNWQPYIGEYDKFEYDLCLKDGTLVENCYPNAGSFSSISDEHDQQSFPESDVSFIRFSENPRYGLNSDVSERPQYEWLDAQMMLPPREEVLKITNPYSPWTTPEWAMLPPAPKQLRNKIAIPVRNSKTDPKIGRNEPCPCGSGKKFKHCCIDK